MQQFALAIYLVLWASSAFSENTENASCKNVRLADIGWTDVSATTGVVSLLLEELGYDATVTILALPVTFAALKNGDVDVFLGNWMPTMQADIKPYLENKSLDVLK